MPVLKKVQSDLTHAQEGLHPALGWYVHVPFCVAKCHYCDFYSLGMGDKSLPEQEFTQALHCEIGLWQNWLKPEVLSSPASIFFGGGTPSLLQAKSIQQILAHLFSLWPQNFNAQHLEITLEMNPRTASLKKLESLREAGVNRISMGVQSLKDDLLKNLGREHNSAAVFETLKILKDLAWQNFSIDLMYGLPQQSLRDFQKTLDAIQPYALKHLSAYELILEEHTPFFERYQYESDPLPQEQEILAMRQALQDFAAVKGLSPYEISNWATPGLECAHNLHYWHYGSFVGVGPSAASFLRWGELSPRGQQYFSQRLCLKTNAPPYGLRVTQVRSLKNYLKHFSAHQDGTPALVEAIDRATAMGEFFMMALRKSQGFHSQDFEEFFGEEIPQPQQNILHQFKQKGWLQKEQGQWAFTPEGVLLSNEVMSELLGVSG